MLGQKYSAANFKFQNCSFGATNIVKNSNKEKYVYSGYGITFDSAGSWSFCVDNSSSFHLTVARIKF